MHEECENGVLIERPSDDDPKRKPQRTMPVAEGQLP